MTGFVGVPFSVAGKPDEQLVGVGHHLLHEHLLVVLLAEGAAVVGRRVADARLDRLQRDDLEGGLGRRAGLRRDHAAEAGHAPAAHVVVLAAHRHQVLLRQRHLRATISAGCARKTTVRCILI